MQRINPLRYLNNRPGWPTLILSFIGLLLGWHLLVSLVGYPAFILPGPADVWQQFVVVIGDGRLLRHSLITISEIIPGLLIGLLVALPLGYLLVKSPLAERLISPYLIASQAIPIIAIAPLLTIWISSTYWSRVLVAALVVFFPILITTIAGLRSVPHELYDLLRSLKATPWQIFRKLEWPAALPTVLAGLKVGATLSVIGALVGEFVQPKSEGLFVVLFTLAAVALTLYGLVTLLERRWLRWRSFGNNRI
jgi:NitT/TauT family transport system permease protein